MCVLDERARRKTPFTLTKNTARSGHLSKTRVSPGEKDLYIFLDPRWPGAIYLDPLSLTDPSRSQIGSANSKYNKNLFRFRARFCLMLFCGVCLSFFVFWSEDSKVLYPLLQRISYFTFIRGSV